MPTPRDFRTQLLQRIAALVAVSVTTAAAGAASGGCIFSSTSGCGDGPGTFQSNECFAWPDEDGGVSITSGSSSGGGGGAGGSGGGGSSGGSGGSGAPPCPSAEEAKARFSMLGVFGVSSVDGAGTFSAGQCCYPITSPVICEGRPFLVEDAPVTAALAASGAARGDWRDESIRPDCSALSADERSSLAAAWTRAALMEHASIASFSRFALDLMALGAPSDLVEDAHRAALDEVRHARLCFALASAYAGEARSPGAMPLGSSIELSIDLVDLATRAWTEGCVGETIAACLAAERLAAATDPAARAALAIIADDEARHAELAFRTVAWALHAGGARVREALTKAASRSDARGPEAEGGADATSTLAGHGQLSKLETKAAVARALRDVVAPAGRALLRGEALEGRAGSPLESEARPS